MLKVALNPTTDSTFLASSHLTFSIKNDPAIYIVIHLCDSMWSFCVETNLCKFFLSFAYICIAIGDPVVLCSVSSVPIRDDGSFC